MAEELPPFFYAHSRSAPRRSRIEFVAVHLKKRQHRQDTNALVAISVGVVLDQAHAGRGS